MLFTLVYKSFQEHKMKKLVILLTVIGFSLFAFAGCSSTAKEQRLETQNHNLRKDLEISNDKLKLMEREVADLKDSGETQKLQNRNERNWNKNERKMNQAEISDKQAEIARINKVNEELRYALAEEIRKGEITIESKQSNLVIYAADRLFFASGSAVLSDNGKSSLNKIGAVLKNRIPDRMVRIEGHTDNVPIGKDLQGKFPSNWELSAVRAVNVVKYLSQDANVDVNRISAAAYGEFSPIASNSTEEGRAINRRIEIQIIDQYFDRWSMNN
jgi:chemotaxis protein MotB